MFTPAQAIAELDKALAAAGEDVVMLEVAAGVPVEPGVPVRGFVRGYKADELVGSIKQGDKRVILSPTGLNGPPETDEKVRIAGADFNIEGRPEIIRMAGIVVRIVLQVRG